MWLWNASKTALVNLGRTIAVDLIAPDKEGGEYKLATSTGEVILYGTQEECREALAWLAGAIGAVDLGKKMRGDIYTGQLTPRHDLPQRVGV